jgi:lipid A 3-O-deacylase
MRAYAQLIALAVLLLLVISPGNVRAQEKFLDEIRVGLYEHDTNIIGHKKETGADFVLELLSRPIISLQFIGTPRLVVGGVINSAGQTNQAYIGLIRTWDLTHEVINSGDAIFLEGMVGGDWNDGKIDVTGTPQEQYWKSHGSHLLFRTGLNLGYRINPTWSVALSFNHISNAGLAKRNEGMNDLGLSVNMEL